jgi:SAM-dependent methyltransferase
MPAASRHDAWSAGNSYETYMGRWSRAVAPRFLDWLDAPPGLHWLDVGCGTGALTAAIVARCRPASVIGVEPSEGFLAQARQQIQDPCASFQLGDAAALPLGDRACDLAVSALAYNFMPQRARALSEMQRVTRPGGRVCLYVWDYPGGGMEMMRAFWTSAIELNPRAADLAEGRRFPFCTLEGLRGELLAGGLTAIDAVPIEVPTEFPTFAAFWQPFTLGAGPAPGYCMNLPEGDREALRAHLQASLPCAADGSIRLKARAWALQGRVEATQ